MKTLKTILILVAVAALSALYAFQGWPEAIYDVNYDATEGVPALAGNSTASQEFTCPHNGLTGIRIRFNKLSRTTYGSYKWILEDTADDSQIASGAVDTGSFSRNGDYSLSFTRQENSKGHTYRFTVQAQNVADDQSISLYLSTAEKNAGQVLYNGTAQTGSLMLKQTIRFFNWETFFVCIALLSYMVFFMKFMSRVFWKS